VLVGWASRVLGGCASRVLVGFAVACLALSAQGARAQPPVPTERVTFEEAIKRAIEKNPSSAIAAAGILRAEALLTEARSAARLQVNGSVITTTLNRGVEFDGATGHLALTPAHVFVREGRIMVIRAGQPTPYAATQ